MKEKIKKVFRKYNNPKYYYVLFLSYLFSFCLFSYVNEFVYNILPVVNIKISSLEKQSKEETGKTSIVILEDEKNKKNYSIKETFLKNKKENGEGLEYIKKGDYGYLVEALSLKENRNAVNISIKKLPNARINFYNVGKSKKILIESGRHSQILDISEEEEGAIVSYFPFRKSKLFFLYTSLSYLAIGFFFFCTILLLISFFRKKKKIEFFDKYTPKKMSLIIYILISSYVFIKISSGTLPKSLFTGNKLFGDQFYYWDLGRLLKEGNFKEITETIFSFRGYITFVIPGIAQLIGDLLKINSLYVFYMINNIWTALLLGYIIPEIYYVLNEKKVKNYQIFLFFSIFSIFWKGMYYSVLADLLGVTFLLYSLLLFLKYKKNQKKVTAFFSGICIAISSLNRGNYVLGIYFIIILFILSNILLLFKKRKLVKIKNTFIIYFFTGVILVCIPQMKINYENGKIGLFPYDKIGSWVRKDETLKEELVNYSLTDLFLGHPIYLKDVTSQKIKRNFVGDMHSRISTKQVFSAFLINPVDTGVMMMKKLFLGLNTKMPETYPDYEYTSHSNLYLFSLLNYFIASTAFFLVFKKKVRKKLLSGKEEIVGSILFVLFTIPQLLLHVEWRYFILLYLMIYYVFSFKFFDYLNDKNFEKTEYLKTVSIIILTLFLINSFYFDVF